MNTNTKMWLHISIAAFSTIALGLQDFKSLSEVADIKAVVLFLNCIIQSLNACRAFIDTSSGRDAIQKENNLANNTTSTTTTISLSS